MCWLVRRRGRCGSNERDERHFWGLGWGRFLWCCAALFSWLERIGRLMVRLVNGCCEGCVLVVCSLWKIVCFVFMFGKRSLKRCWCA